MKNRTYNILISLIIAMATIMVLVTVHSVLPSESWMHRITCLLGGCLPNGLIQGFTYFLFAFGVLEIRRLSANIEYENEVFEHCNEAKRIEKNGRANVIHFFQNLSDQSDFILAKMIVRIAEFSSNNPSVMEAIEYHNSLIGLRDRAELGKQNLLRYVIWAIPSVGFVGTVIGIAASLGKAGEAGSKEGIMQITGLLNIAFDTTLVALLLSIVLVYLFHAFQETADGLYTRIDTYVLDHVVRKS